MCCAFTMVKMGWAGRLRFLRRVLGIVSLSCPETARPPCRRLRCDFLSRSISMLVGLNAIGRLPQHGVADVMNHVIAVGGDDVVGEALGRLRPYRACPRWSSSLRAGAWWIRGPLRRNRRSTARSSIWSPAGGAGVVGDAGVVVEIHHVRSVCRAWPKSAWALRTPSM